MRAVIWSSRGKEILTLLLLALLLWLVAVLSLGPLPGLTSPWPYGSLLLFLYVQRHTGIESLWLIMSVFPAAYVAWMLLVIPRLRSQYPRVLSWTLASLTLLNTVWLLALSPLIFDVTSIWLHYSTVALYLPLSVGVPIVLLRAGWYERISTSTTRATVYYFIVFAWLSSYAFPFLGEVP